MKSTCRFASVLASATVPVVAQALIESPLKNPLPVDIIGKLEEIMRRADNELG